MHTLQLNEILSVYHSNFSYPVRIDAMLLKEDFSQTLDWIAPSIDAIIRTAKDLKENDALHRILYLVLAAGNFLNAVSYDIMFYHQMSPHTNIFAF